MRRLIIIAICLSLTGCASAGWNPLKSWFGRKASAVQKSEAKQEVTEDKTATAAQVEIYKTTLALSQAKAAQPEFTPVQVADRTANNAFSLLQQRSPLTLEAQAQAREIVEGLLSAETSRRIIAESKQATAEQSNARLSAQLEQIRAQLTEQRKAAEAEAAKNLELANQMRVEILQKWAGYGLSAALSIAAIYFKLSGGRATQALSEAIGSIQSKHGAAVATVAKNAADAVLNAGEQQQIFKLVAHYIASNQQAVATSEKVT